MTLPANGFSWLSANFQGVDTLQFQSGRKYGGTALGGWWLMDNFTTSANIQWNGGSGNWSNPSLWSPAPPQPGDNVTIPAGSNITVDTDTGQLGTLTINSPDSTLNVTGGNLSASYIVVQDGTVERGQPERHEGL